MNQQSFFPADGVCAVDQDGEALLWDDFLTPEEAERLFAHLRDSLPWQSETIQIYGRAVPVPRRVCWIGDPDAVYTYSGITHEPLPWPPPLAELKEKIETFTGDRFNSVLANLYRNGNDAMGYHADNERELGREPVIASISLGAGRTFRLRHNRTKTRVDLVLNSGSLLLMRGRLQHCWRHSVPRTPAAVGPRINLTFRLILPTDRKASSR